MSDLKLEPNPQNLGQLASEFAQALSLEFAPRCDTLPMPAFFPNKGEPAIDALELLSHGMEIKTQKKTLEPLFNTEPKPSKIIKRELPPNFRCESCAIRLYPVKKFFRAGKLPVLLLHYNGLLSKSRHQTLPRDRSANFVFGDKSENELFARILEKLKFKWDDFNYQEYPACHFDAGMSSEEDWQERAQNCLEHVGKSVKAAQIKKIILCGNAAVALLGLKEAQSKAQSMDIFPFPFLASSSSVKKTKEEKIDCVVLRSPAALLSLERQREASSDIERRAKLLAEEKEIKSKILSSLQNLLSPFINSLSS